MEIGVLSVIVNNVMPVQLTEIFSCFVHENLAEDTKYLVNNLGGFVTKKFTKVKFSYMHT